MKNPYKGNPFSKFCKGSEEAVRGEAAKAWEHDRVDSTLSRLGLFEWKSRLRRALQQRGDTRQFTFTQFNQVFHNFPILLGCTNLGGMLPLHRQRAAVFPQWFKSFRHLAFITFYEDLWEQLGDLTRVKPVGLIFPRHGFRQGMIVHNGAVDQFVPPKSSCFLYVGGGSKKVHMTLVVQPYIALLDQIKKHHAWEPPDVVDY